MFAVALTTLVAGGAAAGDGDAPGDAARESFFAGIDLQQAGDRDGAVARFQLALSHDPDLHQARLYLAECYHDLGLDERARDELQRYLAHPFPGAEVERASELMEVCGGIPPSQVADTTVADGAEAGSGDASPGGADEPRPPWRTVRLEFGPALSHYANVIGLVTAGPLVEVRWTPAFFLELGAGGRLGLGRYPERDGPLLVPEVGAGVCASIPIRRIRLTAGVHVPVVFSRLPGGARADAGVRGEVGLRWTPRGGPLVLALQLEGGYLVTPTVGGSLRIGLQLGPESRR